MALRLASPAGLLHGLLPLANAPLRPIAIPFLQRIQNPVLPFAAILSIPSIFSDIWESILRAVPKKKTSHMKKRHRQYAGKALKDVTALNRCSGCGRVKRAHMLCPYCVQSVKKWFKGESEPTSGAEKAEV